MVAGSARGRAAAEVVRVAAVVVPTEVIAAREVREAAVATEVGALRADVERLEAVAE